MKVISLLFLKIVRGPKYVYESFWINTIFGDVLNVLLKKIIRVSKLINNIFMQD